MAGGLVNGTDSAVCDLEWVVTFTPLNPNGLCMRLMGARAVHINSSTQYL
jgi:hypothetical protein